jgi:hypothetical protein
MSLYNFLFCYTEMDYFVYQICTLKVGIWRRKNSHRLRWWRPNNDDHVHEEPHNHPKACQSELGVCPCIQRLPLGLAHGVGLLGKGEVRVGWTPVHILLHVQVEERE